MDTTFMNFGLWKLWNSKTSELDALILQLTDKLDLRRSVKSIALSNLSIYYTWENRNSSYNNNKLKISAPTWNDKFELLDRSHSLADIQDYFEYVLKEYGENVDNPSLRINVKKIGNRITFKIKTGYYLELLTPNWRAIWKWHEVITRFSWFDTSFVIYVLYFSIKWLKLVC